jgi:hypothetical protein
MFMQSGTPVTVAHIFALRPAKGGNGDQQQKTKQAKIFTCVMRLK